MPVIRLERGWGLWGLGQAQTPQVIPSTVPAVSTPKAYGFMDGLKIWGTPSQILPALGNIGTIFQTSPTAAAGFLTPPLLVGILLLGGAAGGGYAYGRRRARAVNPRSPARRRSREAAPYRAATYVADPGYR